VKSARLQPQICKVAAAKERLYRLSDNSLRTAVRSGSPTGVTARLDRDLVTTGLWALDCPVKPGNDIERFNLVESTESRAGN
jgi:hypothetical protein